MAMRISVRYELYRSLHTRIAKRLGVSRSFVWRVAHGERRSEKVENALRKELARLQAKTEKALALGDVIATVTREVRLHPSSRRRARSNSRNGSC